MITLLDLIVIISTVAGIMAAGGFGYDYGVFWAIVGAVFGGLIGYKIGMVPTVITIRRTREKMAKLTVNELLDRLYDHQYFGPEDFTPNYLLMELAARGEDIRKHIYLVLDLLEAESALRRVFGFGALLSAYPGLAKHIRGYHPEKPVEVCRKRVAKLREVLESASGETKEE